MIQDNRQWWAEMETTYAAAANQLFNFIKQQTGFFKIDKLFGKKYAELMRNFAKDTVKMIVAIPDLENINQGDLKKQMKNVLFCLQKVHDGSHVAGESVATREVLSVKPDNQGAVLQNLFKSQLPSTGEIRFSSGKQRKSDIFEYVPMTFLDEDALLKGRRFAT